MKNKTYNRPDLEIISLTSLESLAIGSGEAGNESNWSSWVPLP